jgi:Uncharacterized alpha/beta hydrolase domain (DUF2235)
MKRLVICCDGTWNRPDAPHVTNIEKIARTVQTDLTRTDGVQQLVLYLSGVGGAGYHTDRLLGGAFGLGLFHNVLAGYRFLSINYEPGDEIYVFGFSRGAYTARSLAGMIGKVGLLTRRAVVQEKLPEAVERYKGVDSDAGKKGASNDEFKRDFCHPDTPIHFIGVFDTVGALGVPGALRRRHQFHDVKLGAAVRTARQALAIDERRMKFEPCLWDAIDESCCEDPRVKQVWFEGCHSDVGGGYKDTGLSDTALLWMVAEANEKGLAFDEELLARYVACGDTAIRHDSSKLLFKVLDLVIRAKIKLGRVDGRAFDGRDRRLHRPECVSVRVAGSTADHYRADEGYRPRNLTTMARATDDFADCVEPVIGLPEKDYATITGRLAERGLSLGRSGVVIPSPRSVAADPSPAAQRAT